MKTIALTVCGAVAAVLTSTTLLAQTVIVVPGPYQFSDAGELNSGSTPSFLQNYASSVTVSGGFETFAADSDYPVYYNQPYNYTLSQSDVQGVALTQGAALLYYDFSQGDLPGYDYSVIPSAYQRIQDAGELQAAIWALQGYPNPGPQYPSGTVNNPYYSYALTTDPTALLPNDGKYDVDIMQLESQTYGTGQNLLVVPAPDGVTTCTLLAGSVGVLASIRRKIGGGAS